MVQIQAEQCRPLCAGMLVAVSAGVGIMGSLSFPFFRRSLGAARAGLIGTRSSKPYYYDVITEYVHKMNYVDDDNICKSRGFWRFCFLDHLSLT